MPRATMPEAPVNKQRQPFAPENKIWPAENILVSPQPEIPLARKIEINFSSVSLLPCDFIAAMTCDRFLLEKTSDIYWR